MGLTASTTSVAGQSMTSENVHVKSACTGEAGAEATVPEEELQIVRDALFPHDLRVQRTLGAGSFGSVHAAYCDQTQNDVAVKVIDFSPDDLEEDRRAFRLEVSAMKALGDSDFIVSHERSWMNADKSGGYIVMELVDGQDLEEYLDQYGHRIGQTDAKRIGLRIAKAVSDSILYPHCADELIVASVFSYETCTEQDGFIVTSNAETF
uniref:Protein kinase domain-containing protein n=1 Tax=Spongospora subterranea TaxID=70186 RepID=A0A0H5RES5_9EUKA|eukprot:CRZ12720.1 hypothetical protein [Spongospora subterranea]